MVRAMPVSVKVYCGHGSAVEIRRFMFRPELYGAVPHQRSSIHPAVVTSHGHQSHMQSTSTLFKEEAPSVYQSLVDKIRALYNGLNLQEMHLCWKDDDSDYVVFSSDDELKVAINSTTDNTLRIYIKEKIAASSSRSRADFRRSCGDLTRSESAGLKHVRERDHTPCTGSFRRRKELGDLEADVPESPDPPTASNHVAGNSRSCCECQGEGRGVWYKCTVCADFFLCSDCEHRGLHDQHIMVRTTTGTQTVANSLPR